MSALSVQGNLRPLFSSLEVAIVAIGRAKWVWNVDRGDGKGERGLKIGVGWSGDHRVVEGCGACGVLEGVCGGAGEAHWGGC